MIFGLEPRNLNFKKNFISCLNDYADLKVHYETFKGLFIKWTTFTLTSQQNEIYFKESFYLRKL